MDLSGIISGLVLTVDPEGMGAPQSLLGKNAAPGKDGGRQAAETIFASLLGSSLAAQGPTAPAAAVVTGSDGPQTGQGENPEAGEAIALAAGPAVPGAPAGVHVPQEAEGQALPLSARSTAGQAAEGQAAGTGQASAPAENQTIAGDPMARQSGRDTSGFTVTVKGMAGEAQASQVAGPSGEPTTVAAMVRPETAAAQGPVGPGTPEIPGSGLELKTMMEIVESTAASPEPQGDGKTAAAPPQPAPPSAQSILDLKARQILRQTNERGNGLRPYLNSPVRPVTRADEQPAAAGSGIGLAEGEPASAIPGPGTSLPAGQSAPGSSLDIGPKSTAPEAAGSGMTRLKMVDTQVADPKMSDSKMSDLKMSDPKLPDVQMAEIKTSAPDLPAAKAHHPVLKASVAEGTKEPAPAAMKTVQAEAEGRQAQAVRSDGPGTDAEQPGSRGPLAAAVTYSRPVAMQGQSQPMPPSAMSPNSAPKDPAATAAAEAAIAATGMTPGTLLEGEGHDLMQRAGTTLESGSAARPGASSSAPAPVRQVLAGLDRAEPGQTVTIRLQPEELGSVEVRLELNGGRLSIEMLAGSQQAETALRENIRELTDGLREKGGRFTQVEVRIEVRDGGEAKAEARGDDRRDQGRDESRQDNQNQDRKREQGGRERRQDQDPRRFFGTGSDGEETR